MANFDTKIFNAESFAQYVNSVPNTKKNALIKSGAIGANLMARQALANQTGSLYATVPYFGLISGKTSQNNTGATDIQSTSTDTFGQGFVVASRMDSWTEKNFSTNITAGVSFMTNVANQIANYKQEVGQDIAIAMLDGIYKVTTTGDTPQTNANKEFVTNHTYDISGTGDGLVGASTLNTAVQKACGDNKDIFTLVFMHSTVATNLENLKLLNYWTYTNSEGVGQQLNIASWNGRTVIIDDDLPVTGSGVNTKYTTYVLGQGSINLDNIGDAVPYEMSRDAAKNGGQDTLYVRDRYICGMNGFSYTNPNGTTVSPDNAALSTGTNWNVICNGTSAIQTKSIPIARIISKG